MKFNWKRIISVSFIALLIVSLSFPAHKASAYDGGLLHGKPITVFQDGQGLTSTSAVTDGNALTQMGLQSSNRSRFLYYEFSTPVDIESFSYQISAKPLDSTVYFYSSSKTNYQKPTLTESNLLGAQNFSNSLTGENITANYSGVKAIAIHSNASDDTNLFEFDVFSQGVDVTPPSLVGSLSAVGTDGMIELNWTNPPQVDFSHVKILRDDVLLVDNLSDNYYFDTDVVNETSYQYAVISVDTKGNQSAPRTIQATPSNTDSVPPSEVTSISQDVTLDTITFDFVKPLDDDFERTILYKDGVEYDSTTGTTITVTGLSEATTYSFKFTTVDMTGNESTGVIRSVTTLSSVDDVAPSAPTGLTHIVGNGSITLDWNNNQETDLDGYFVYVDGQKVNATPIKSSYYTINALTNSQDYQVAVSAVDTSGNESPISTLTTVTPSESAMPLLSIGGYDLTDVADGVGVWFASLWLILAFAVAIPLSFYIANRVKLLFLA
ncbi:MULTISPECIES: hypothetical protein [unclassified Exiguobacterium]|uniref:fibronectin type III domain-containing protein n=1 Tax=unclassified Exiguobacterium TaxID=2644629 RepID=UPI001BECA297|nr:MULTISPECIES: hypothetical protein [unclassified Exiguobacterium]